jgi:hypothetical protein
MHQFQSLGARYKMKIAYSKIDFVWFHKMISPYIRSSAIKKTNSLQRIPSSNSMEYIDEDDVFQQQGFSSGVDSMTKKLSRIPSNMSNNSGNPFDEWKGSVKHTFYDDVIAQLPFEDTRFDSRILELCKILYRTSRQASVATSIASSNNSNATTPTNLLHQQQRLNSFVLNRSINLLLVEGLGVCSAERVVRCQSIGQQAAYYEMDINFLAKRNLYHFLPGSEGFGREKPQANISQQKRGSDDVQQYLQATSLSHQSQLLEIFEGLNIWQQLISMERMLYTELIKDVVNTAATPGSATCTPMSTSSSSNVTSTSMSVGTPTCGPSMSMSATRIA